MATRTLFEKDDTRSPKIIKSEREAPVKKEVVIIVPIYRNFRATKRASFEQLIKVLGSYPISILHPKGFNVENLIADYPAISELAMDNKWFEGKMTYSALCLNEELYNHYLDYEYMLIYQLDAWVFRDDLKYWITKGYDYIGAPWVPEDYVYKRLIEYPYKTVRKLFPYDMYNIPHTIRNFSVGNGGFSLRRISTMIMVVNEDKDLIDGLVEHEVPEDVFFGLIAPQIHNFKVPDWKTALAFSWERAMKHCYRLNNRQLPFGCHSWQVPKRYKWWKKYIQL